MLIKECTQEIITSCKDIIPIMSAVYSARPPEELHKEYVYAIGLDSKNRLLYIDLVAIGTVNYAVPPLREFMRMALLKDAITIIAVHNHPSGDIRPGADDRLFTKRLREVGDNLQIPLLDHVIIGTNPNIPEVFYSFREGECW